LHSEIELTNSVVLVFRTIGTFYHFIAVVEFDRNGVSFSNIVGVVLEVEEVAVSVITEKFLDESLSVSRFPDTIGSDKEKKLHSC
jgi:ABC-type glucose/galactose transport system permease subunit